MTASPTRVAYLRKLLENGYSIDEVAAMEGIKPRSVQRMVSQPNNRRNVAEIMPKKTGVEELEAMLYDEELIIPEGFNDKAVAPVLSAKKLGIICDLHIPVHDVRALTISLKWLKERGIDTLLILGDGVDSYGLTRHGRDGRNYTIAYEYRVTREVLAVIRRFFGDSVAIHWVAGNHDQWLDRYIRAQAEKDARLDTLLQDEDGNQLITLPSKLKLHEFGIAYHDNGMGVQFGELRCIHGHEVPGGAKYVAAQKLTRVKTNVAFGHHHTSQEWYETTLDGSVRGAWAIGCLSQTSPRYMRFGSEVQGFAFVQFESDGTFVFENKKIINGVVR